MWWRRLVFVLIILAIVVLARYCAPAPLGPEALPACDYAVPDAIGEQDANARYVEEGTFFVDNGRGQDAIDALEASGVLDGEAAVESRLNDPEAVADLINDFYCSPYDRALSGGDLADVVGTDIWAGFDAAVDVVILPDGVTVDAAIDALGGPDNQFGGVPEQMFSTLNHFGAFPGPDSKPVAQAKPAVSQPATGGGQRIAVIDTGFHGTVGVIRGAGLSTRRRTSEYGIAAEQPNSLWRSIALLWNTKQLDRVDGFRPGPGRCAVSHGEFVASVIRQMEPTAEIYGFNAFYRRPSRKASVVNCWETSETGIIVALGRAELAAEAGDFKFDAVNMSFGSISHNTAGVSIPPTGLSAGFMTQPAFADEFVAAAGNTMQPDPVYPADFASVTGITAEDKDDNSVFWDAAGQPISGSRILPASDVALGCHLVGHATENPSERFMWSGTSFAAPLYIGNGGTPPNYADLPEAMVGEGQLPSAELDHCPPPVVIE